MSRLWLRFAGLRHAWLQLRLRECAFRLSRCPLCGPSLLVRLSNSEMGVRCLRCGGSAVHLSLARVLLELCPQIEQRSVYELSARGAWAQYLRRRVADLMLSEYVEDLETADVPGDARSENIERLSFADAHFDVMTCTDVFEHVADDRVGFCEALRVLRPGGLLVFTVPLGAEAVTVERARRTASGAIEHLLPAQFHGDRLRGVARVLSFRDYGRDLPQRLLAAGFAEASIVRLPAREWWGWARPVIVARKAERINDTAKTSD